MIMFYHNFSETKSNKVQKHCMRAIGEIEKNITDTCRGILLPVIIVPKHRPVVWQIGQ